MTFAFWINSLNHHLRCDRLAVVRIFKHDHPRHVNRGRHRGDILACSCLHRSHLPISVVNPFHRTRFNHDVRQKIVQTITHLRRETSHHTVDHNHCGDAQHDTDDTGQCDVAGSQISNTQQQLVHRTHSIAGLKDLKFEISNFRLTSLQRVQLFSSQAG